MLTDGETAWRDGIRGVRFFVREADDNRTSNLLCEPGRDARPTMQGRQGLHGAPAERGRTGRDDHGCRGGDGALGHAVARAVRRDECGSLLDGRRAGPHERGTAKRACLCAGAQSTRWRS